MTRFWETTHLPLPKANINTYFSLGAKCWLRERYVGSLAETYNDPAFFAIESRKRAVEYINADDVIVFFFIS